jgi:hypothetical protein
MPIAIGLLDWGPGPDALAVLLGRSRGGLGAGRVITIVAAGRERATTIMLAVGATGVTRIAVVPVPTRRGGTATRGRTTVTTITVPVPVGTVAVACIVSMRSRIISW